MIRLFELSTRRVLVTRESARAMAAALGKELDDNGEVLHLDFAGIEGMTPSYLDELLRVIHEEQRRRRIDNLEVRLLRPPMRLSSKFEAVGRSHGLAITSSVDGATWHVVDKDEKASTVA